VRVLKIGPTTESGTQEEIGYQGLGP